MWTRVVVVGLVVGGSAGATEAPLSAIDWLSRSVEAQPETGLAGGVTVEPLEAAPRAVGHVSPQAVGLPPTIWAESRAADLVALLSEMPQDMPLPLRDALATLLTLEAPVDDPEQGFLLARIDALLALGRIEDARRLIADAGDGTPALFRRGFDIALLTGHENDACRVMEARPDLAPTYPARIFCLARRGDWPAAALTLETAHALDVLTKDEDALLGRFLDDGEGDLLPPPKRPDPITPLDFRLYEAIGEPLSTRGLPLAFAHAELRPQNGWKARLEAAERLYRAGAVPAETLLDLYGEKAPAASGGVWDRVAAVQAWRDAAPEDKPQAAAAAAEVLGPAGLARLVGRDDAPVATPLDPETAVDPDIAALIADDRLGEAALTALLRAAAAWDGDADDRSRALAALDAVVLGRIAGTPPRWASR